jgi:hypothetical protein
MFELRTGNDLTMCNTFVRIEHSIPNHISIKYNSFFKNMIAQIAKYDSPDYFVG